MLLQNKKLSSTKNLQPKFPFGESSKNGVTPKHYVFRWDPLFIRRNCLQHIPKPLLGRHCQLRHKLAESLASLKISFYFLHDLTLLFENHWFGMVQGKLLNNKTTFCFISRLLFYFYQSKSTYHYFLLLLKYFLWK